MKNDLETVYLGVVNMIIESGLDLLTALQLPEDFTAIEPSRENTLYVLERLIGQTMRKHGRSEKEIHHAIEHAYELQLASYQIASLPSRSLSDPERQIIDLMTDRIYSQIEATSRRHMDRILPLIDNARLSAPQLKKRDHIVNILKLLISKIQASGYDHRQSIYDHVVPGIIETLDENDRPAARAVWYGQPN
jgi:hypothetical protein